MLKWVLFYVIESALLQALHKGSQRNPRVAKPLIGNANLIVFPSVTGNNYLTTLVERYVDAIWGQSYQTN